MTIISVIRVNTVETIFFFTMKYQNYNFYTSNILHRVLVNRILFIKKATLFMV